MLKIYKKASPFILATLLILGAIAYIMFPELFYNNKMSYEACLNAISSNVVYSIEIDEDSDFVIVTLQGASGHREDNSKRKYIVSTIGSNNFLLDHAECNDVKIIQESHRIFSFLRIFKFFIIICVISGIYQIYHTKRKNPKIAVVNGESCSTTEQIQDTHVTFKDVAGLDIVIKELNDIIDFLKNSEKYTKLGAKIPRGVILYGKPGTGKTLMTKAVAGEAGVSFISACGSEFVDEFIGVGARNIRKLFEEAKKKAPCIIFIDEIDAIGRKRENGSQGGDSEINHTIAQLLQELDGFQTINNIIIFATTNRLDILDPALTRPGRFDRIINIGLPDVCGRKAILEVHTRNKPLSEEVSLDEIAKNTAGFSGAQLENLLNEAAIHAVRKQHTCISKEDVQEAFRKIIVGLEKSYIMSDKEKKDIASYEVGKAIVSLLMPTQPNIKEVSIIPHNTAGGYTWNDTPEDKNYNSKEELKEKLAVLMAGHVAEELIIGDISTKASKDIDMATQIATSMVYVYGMDPDIGPISVKSMDARGINSLGKQIGDKIVKLVKEAEEKALKLITEHRPLVEEVIQILLNQETITGEEIRKIYNEYNSKCDK